jgi:hypothetical protein
LMPVKTKMPGDANEAFVKTTTKCAGKSERHSPLLKSRGPSIMSWVSAVANSPVSG